jgi:hypothetical protein
MTSATANSSLFKNLQQLSERFPVLGEKLCKIRPGIIQTATTDDGGFCYVKELENGKYQPLSDTAPIQKTRDAITAMEERLSNALAPVVVVGLNPGYILDNIYKHVKENCYDKFMARRIYVIINSIECLYGWLKLSDREEILTNPAIELYWHEDVKEIAQHCEEDYTHSHLFVPVSTLPEQEVMQIIDPLAQIFLKRQKEEESLYQENSSYYEQQSDDELDEILAGKAKRKPRMLIPSHASSTVVQYSVRDTKVMFEKEGWDVKIIHMKTDLSRWRVLREINEFKPDVYMLVNHLRTQEESYYPPDMMFITWVQDTISYINNTENAKLWNEHIESKAKRRDRIIGYVGQIREYGYSEDRLEECPMIVNQDIFKPRELTPEEIEKYSCDVCFASNRSKETSLIVKEDLTPKLEKFDFTEVLLMQIHDHLWAWYRAEETCTSYKELEDTICEISEVAEIFNSLEDKNDHDFVIQRLFWELNDVIYRHVVLEWIDEIGDIKLHLYGRGWESHPRFSKYAKGILEHGEELTIAYRAAKKCIHLNSMEGDHQRLNEILSGGAQIITRLSKTAPQLTQELIDFVEGNSTEPDYKTLSMIYSQVKNYPTKPNAQIWKALKSYIDTCKQKENLKSFSFQKRKNLREQITNRRFSAQSSLAKESKILDIFRRTYQVTKLDEVIASIKNLITTNKKDSATPNKWASILSLIHFHHISINKKEEHIQLLRDINPENLEESSRTFYSNLILQYTPHEKLIDFIATLPENIISQKDFHIRIGSTMRTNFISGWQNYWLKDLLTGNFSLTAALPCLPFLNFATINQVQTITQSLITKLNNEGESILNNLKTLLFIKHWNIKVKKSLLLQQAEDLYSNNSKLIEKLPPEELMQWAHFLDLFGISKKALEILTLPNIPTNNHSNLLKPIIYQNNFLFEGAYEVLFSSKVNNFQKLQLAFIEILHLGSKKTPIPKELFKNDMFKAFKAVIYSERGEHSNALETLPSCKRSPLLKLWEAIVLSRATSYSIPKEYCNIGYINKVYLKSHGFSYESTPFLKRYLQKRLSSPEKPINELFENP